MKGRTYEDKCKELGLDTLECRRNKQDLLQAYKIFKGKDKVDPDQLFTAVYSTYHKSDKIHCRSNEYCRGTFTP